LLPRPASHLAAPPLWWLAQTALAGGNGSNGPRRWQWLRGIHDGKGLMAPRAHHRVVEDRERLAREA
jgi:hypothetical protein